ERIRYKVAASKRKGIWMGGTAPMGYDHSDRKLVVNREEARTVQHIFERYLELGSVRLLKQDLDARGITSPVKGAKNGHHRGGKPFSRGGLYHLLSNPVFIGEIRHKQERYPGQHEGIVQRELWEQVQQRLRERTARRSVSSGSATPRSPLGGKLFDETGEPLLVQGAAKGRRRYRYYVSRKLIHAAEHEDSEYGWRLSAPEIERSVSIAGQRILADHSEIARACEHAGIDAELLPSILRSTQGWIERLCTANEAIAA